MGIIALIASAALCYGLAARANARLQSFEVKQTQPAKTVVAPVKKPVAVKPQPKGMMVKTKLGTMVPLTFCVYPQCPNPQIPLSTWVWTVDAQHYIVTTANGTNYGRSAVGTYYWVPASKIVPDTVFKNGFN